jgi:hypothetical protein
MCIADRYPMMSEANIRASGSSVGKNSTVQSQLWRKVAYFIEEYRSAIGRFENGPTGAESPP